MRIRRFKKYEKNRKKQRLKEEGSQLVTNCNQLKMTAQDRTNMHNGRRRTLNDYIQRNRFNVFREN